MPAYQRITYPDVLGTITGGTRANIGVVQCALAVYPRVVVQGKPFEVLVLLQNTCDKPIQVEAAMQLPQKDPEGNRFSLTTPRMVISVELGPGETSLLHAPVTVRSPSQPGRGRVVGVRVSATAPQVYGLVRPPDGGRTATMLSMSAVRLDILRGVGFTATVRQPGFLVTSFDVLAGQTDMFLQVDLQPRLETLWSVKELAQEQAKYAALAEQAARIARTLNRKTVLAPLIAITEQRFGQAGIPLHPGESLHIGKTLTYVMEDGLDLEEGLSRNAGRWFTRLAATDPAMVADVPRLLENLYIAIVYDATRVGMLMIEREARQDFGGSERHLRYAEEILAALEGQIDLTLSHVYLPLVMAGVLLNTQIKQENENPWQSLSDINEARMGRERLTGSEFAALFQVLDAMIHNARDYLIKTNVPRPNAL